MTYHIDLTKFGDGRSLHERVKPRDVASAKFNIRVRKSDLRLIDLFAELGGTSRASVLNDVVKVILTEMLEEMREEDEDSAADLALYVDQKLGKSEQSIDGWSAALFGVQSRSAMEYWYQREESQRSDKSMEIQRRIQGLKK